MKPIAFVIPVGLLLLTSAPVLAQTSAGTLTVAKPLYRAGQPVQMIFRVVNTSQKPITYNFATGQRFDVRAERGKGLTVWKWSSGRLFSQSLASVTVASGKVLIYLAVWSGRDSSGSPVVPGVYVLVARSTSSNHSVTAKRVVRLR